MLTRIPEYVASLVAEFETEREAFRKLTQTAPPVIAANSSPAQAEAHVELLRQTGVLTGLAADRYQLAIAGNELVALERDHSHLILDPYEDRVTVHQMNELIALVNAAMPTTVDEWIRLAEVGCSLAAYQSAPLRRDRFEAIRYANGMAADGGLRDRLLSDAAALIGSPAPRALIRAQ